MIGIFDSGFGGLQTLKYFKQKLPDYDYIYLADSINAPYGDKSADQIIKHTFEGLEWLFANGACIVILACNTASAYAVRLWQTAFPHKKVLSVTIPGIEYLIENDLQNVTLLATNATIFSGIFEKKYFELTGKTINIQNIPAPKLVKLIENGVNNLSEINCVLDEYLSKIDNNSQGIILGCTHYPILKNEICEYGIPADKLIDPALLSVYKFTNYLERHCDIKSSLSKCSKTYFYTTGCSNNFDIVGKRIYGKAFNSTTVSY